MANEPIDLMRADLRPLYRTARDTHPALLVQRGLERHDDNDKTAKTEHIARICNIPTSDLYRRAYARWRRATSNPLRFRALILRLDTRLFAGLSGGGALETGCALGHSHGAPYLPGSAVKGVLQHHARRSEFGRAHPESCDQLFGAEPDDERPGGLSGLVTCHDAWWVPDSAPKPLVQEVVTTHHPDYYRNEGQSPATDLDSPIPNAQIGVQGSFLFVLEGPSAWTELAEEMLVTTLDTNGIGAKTRSGYGYLRPDERENDRLALDRTTLHEESTRLQADELERRRLAGLSPARRDIHRVQQELNAYLALGEAERLIHRPTLIPHLNGLLDAAANWPAEADRTAAADLLQKAFEDSGWGDPGKKGQQKRKQEDKRRKAIERIRPDADA